VVHRAPQQHILSVHTCSTVAKEIQASLFIRPRSRYSRHLTLCISLLVPFLYLKHVFLQILQFLIKIDNYIYSPI
jgi:hypothetical protein